MNDFKDELTNKRNYWRKRRLQEKEIFKKQEDIHFRCTENEKKYIRLKAKEANMTISDFMLENSLYGEINLIDLSNLREFTIAINRLNNNINQIARSLNTLVLQDKISPIEKEHMISKIDNYKKLINDLLNQNEKLQRKIKSSIDQKQINFYDPDIDYSNVIDNMEGE